MPTIEKLHVTVDGFAREAPNQLPMKFALESLPDRRRPLHPNPSPEGEGLEKAQFHPSPSGEGTGVGRPDRDEARELPGISLEGSVG